MPHRFSVLALAAANLFALPACGGDPLVVPERSGSQAQAWIAPPPHPVADPGAYQVQEEYMYAVLPGYGGTSARIYYPTSGKKRLLRNTPLVVLLNGNGFSYSNYGHLAAHLASYGMAVLALQADAASPTQNCVSFAIHCIEDRAERAHLMVDWFRDNWGQASSIDFSTLALLGHSQGGEAALRLAQRVSSDPDLGDPSPRAVVAMAPSDMNAIELDGNDARSLLVLYGTNDEDVRPPLTQVAGTTTSTQLPHPGPFALYDRAGTETDIDGKSPTSARLRKHMKLIYGANHRQFSDLCGFTQCPPKLSWVDAISCEAQQDITKGAVNAFLRWHLIGQSDYQVYFNGQEEPLTGYTWYSLDPWEWVDVYPQHSDGLGSRLVIDNFQDGTLANATIGAPVVLGPGVTAEVVDNQGMLAHSPHGPFDGQRLHVTGIDGTSDAWIGWMLGDGGLVLDATPYTHLRFRVGRLRGSGPRRTMADDPLLDDPGYAVGVQVIAGSSSNLLTTWGNASNPTDGRGHLPEPHDAVGKTLLPVCLQNIGPTERYTMVHMRSFRIPLADLGTNLSAITEIFLSFPSPVMAGEELYIDNLELVSEPGQP